MIFFGVFGFGRVSFGRRPASAEQARRLATGRRFGGTCGAGGLQRARIREIGGKMLVLPLVRPSPSVWAASSISETVSTTGFGGGWCFGGAGLGGGLRWVGVRRLSRLRGLRSGRLPLRGATLLSSAAVGSPALWPACV